MSKTLALAVGAALVATSANALPVFTMGSFSFGLSTGNGITTTGDVTIDTAFDLINNSFSTTQPVTPSSNDFTQVTIPITINLASTLDFGNLADFDFSDPGLGSFTATGDSQVSTTTGGNTGATWEVTGNYTPGNSFDPSSPSGSGTETFTFTQDGGLGQPITLAATFAAPEPATLSVFGAALAGLGFARRRRK